MNLFQQLYSERMGIITRHDSKREFSSISMSSLQCKDVADVKVQKASACRFWSQSESDMRWFLHLSRSIMYSGSETLIPLYPSLSPSPLDKPTSRMRPIALAKPRTDEEAEASRNQKRKKRRTKKNRYTIRGGLGGWIPYPATSTKAASLIALEPTDSISKKTSDPTSHPTSQPQQPQPLSPASFSPEASLRQGFAVESPRTD
eukprot:767157-Hanusia_phi.AAC.2